MKKLRHLKPALDEAAEAARYYNEQRPGLGSEFLAEYKQHLIAISRRPNLWPQFEKPFRRCLLKRFPFAVIYVISGDHVVIVSVFHLRRAPGSWRGRI